METSFSNAKNSYAFIKDNIYEVLDYEVATDENYVPLGDNSYDVTIYSIDDDIGYNFNTKGNEQWIFSEYFYTEAEYRKIKLDKINNT